MILELQFATCITIVGHCHVTFPYKENLSLFGHCHRTFFMHRKSSTFWNVCTKSNSVLFLRFIWSENDSIFRWQLYCYQWFPASLQFIQKTVFLLLQTHMKNILWVKNTVLQATMTRCASLPFVDITFYQQETLQSFYENGMHSVSTTITWTVCINCSSTDSVAKLLSRVDIFFNNRKRAVRFSCRHRGKDRLPSIARRDSWGKSTKNNCWAPSKCVNRHRLVDESCRQNWTN